MMAGERTETPCSHFLERCWEPQLPTIDPSVQVCLGVIVSGVGGRDGALWAGNQCPALKDAQELCLIPEHQRCFDWCWSLSHRLSL